MVDLSHIMTITFCHYQALFDFRDVVQQVKTPTHLHYGKLLLIGHTVIG